MPRPMDGLNSGPWVSLGRLADGWQIEARAIPPRDKRKYGYDLWSNGLAFEAFGIGRTYKLSIRAPGQSNGLWLLNFDTKGRMVNASFTGSRWIDAEVPVPRFDHDFRLLPYPRYRPEMHRLIGGTWIRGKWTDRYDQSELLYRPEIVPQHDPMYRAAMQVLDGVVARVEDLGRDSAPAAVELANQLRQLPLLTSAQLFDETRRFHSILDVGELISVEPPELAFDHYHAIPVKVQGGCGGPCTFCNLYDRKIRVLPADMVERQMDAMADYLGEELDHFLKVVLLEGDALTVPSSQLIQLLTYARHRFELADEPFAHAFAKASTIVRKSTAELAMLRESGLLNVNIGLESGCQDLLDVVKRGQRIDVCQQAIRKLCDARIGVSVNVIAGIGGSSFHDRHLGQTVNFLRDLPVGVEVFYAPLMVDANARYHRHAFTDASDEEMQAQILAFQRASAAKEYIFIPM